jgi:hypothetical protein
VIVYKPGVLQVNKPDPIQNLFLLGGGRLVLHVTIDVYVTGILSSGVNASFKAQMIER